MNTKIHKISNFVAFLIVALAAIAEIKGAVLEPQTIQFVSIITFAFVILIYNKQLEE